MKFFILFRDIDVYLHGMKPATLSEIKRELKSRDQTELLDLCLRLGRFKKDNKELLTYLLFDSQDEQAYIESIKYEIDDLMEEININQLYYAKKSLRKILRNLGKYIRYSGHKETEIEVRLYFCQAVKNSGIAIAKSLVLVNMYNRQLQNINKAIAGLHEDKQADYQQLISSVSQ